MEFLNSLEWDVIFKLGLALFAVILLGLALANTKTREAMAGLGLRLAEILLLFFETKVNAGQKIQSRQRMARARASK